MRLSLITLICLIAFSCKEASKNTRETKPVEETVATIDTSKYPAALNKILEAHGGLDTWKSKRVLSFEIPKSDVIEKHTIDLRTRDEKIESGAIVMGSDGIDIWLKDEANSYKGNAVFYHNLMFYFYSMPFVLADNGIKYSETEALEFEGKSYPGLRISFDDGVGVSSKDEYYLHYDAETYQMAWLGYTVTFRSGEKSDDIRWIRYNDWQNVDGVILPNSLTWHEYEGRVIGKAEPALKFENVTLSEMALADDFFKQPEAAKVVNAKE